MNATMPATPVTKNGIQQFETTYNGWELFAWEWMGSWRVTAEIADRKNLRCGITWGGGDKVGMWEAIDDAKARIDKDDVQWRQYERWAGGIRLAR